MLTPIVYNYVYMITLKQNTNIFFFLVERQATFSQIDIIDIFCQTLCDVLSYL